MEGMDAIVTLISNTGFPIACCCVLFYLNNKLTTTLNDLKTTLAENTVILKQLLDKED